jgi:hypothetical protein
MFANVETTTWKSAPCALDKAPGTFSQRAILEYRPLVFLLISFMILIASINNPDRSPANPARFPATDKS